jgi:hypothetical protein
MSTGLGTIGIFKGWLAGETIHAGKDRLARRRKPAITKPLNAGKQHVTNL